MKTRMTILSVLLTMFSVVALGSQQGPSASTEAWDAFAKRFTEFYLKLHPEFAVYLGRHEFDGMLPDWSAEGLKKEASWLRRQRDSLGIFDAKTLDQTRYLENRVILTQINSDLFWLEQVKSPYRDPTYYSLNPSAYVTRDYAPLEKRLAAYTRFARGIPAAVDQIKSNLRPPIARAFIDIGRTIFGGIASYFQNDVPAVFSGVKDDALQEEFRAANAEAVRAVNDLTAWLEQQSATANDSFALGPTLFSEMLRVSEHVDLPLAELERIGREDLERNLGALREACAQLAPGKSVQECMAMVEADKPAGDLLKAAQAQVAELKVFMTTQGIASIPGTEEVYVEESPPYMRWNMASINIPGPFEKNLPSRYYITLPDSSWSMKAQEEYIPGRTSLLFTSAHEVWPGHFLQSLHERQNPSNVGKIFGSYAFSEGWAHYTEEMMWDAGLGKGNPEAHIGQLNKALLRNVRFLSAIGLHTGGMTVQQSEQMFREKAFQDSATANQQARRGTFDPGYLSYTLGKLMIMKLRDDWCATRGGRAAWGKFHDTFLSFGAPPVPLVREMMLGPNRGPLFKPVKKEIQGNFMKKIMPFLWYKNNAGEAITFYTSIFKNSTIDNLARDGNLGSGQDCPD